MEENVKEKIGFFKRFKMAICNLEDYGYFLTEKFSVSVKYFLLLIALISVFVAILYTYSFSQMLSTVTNYINNELPDYKYEDGNLSFDDVVKAYDSKYFVRLIIDTKVNQNEDSTLVDNYIFKDVSQDEIGIIMLKDKFYAVTNGTVVIEDKYSELDQELKLDVSNKAALIDSLNNLDKKPIYLIFILGNFLAAYLDLILTYTFNIIGIALFAWLVCKIFGVNLKNRSIFSLSIYSNTFGVVLICIYNYIYFFTGFSIKSIELIYLLITYVYVIAAILMIKYDLIKQVEELQEIYKVQKEVAKEAEDKIDSKEVEETKEEPKEEIKEENNEDTESNQSETESSEIKKEEPEDKEPDGSEI